MRPRFPHAAALAALSLLAAAALPAANASRSVARAQIECQRPMTTGEEIFALKNIGAAAACPVVRDLGHWESTAGHISELYRCSGPGKHTPVLELSRFEGWRLSLSRSGYFQMSRGRSSFEVIGTDFPLNCS